MIELSKTTAFVIFFVMATLFGISLSGIDWNVVFGGNSSPNEIYKEILETLTFFLLSIAFMFNYVRALKKEREDKQ